MKLSDIDEAVDPREFILGDFPFVDLIKCGFQQDALNDQWYNKRLANGYTIVVQGGGTADKGPYDERSYLDVYTKDGRKLLWSSIAQHKQVSAAVAAIERIVLGATGDESELYHRLNALNDEIGQFRMQEGVDPKGFIMGTGPWVAFKKRLEELGWTYIVTKKTPTVHGSMIDVHEFEVTCEPFHFSADASAIRYTAYASEFFESGQTRLSVYASGIKYAVLHEIEFETEEFIQPDDMPGAEFAELVDDEIRAVTGPEEPPEEEQS